MGKVVKHPHDGNEEQAERSPPDSLQFLTQHPGSRVLLYIDPAIPSSRTNAFHLMYFYMYSLHKMTRLHEHIILEISVYNILL